MRDNGFKERKVFWPLHQSLDQVLHNLIVMQLEYAVEDRGSLISVPVTTETIKQSLSVIRSVNDLAPISTYHLHEDADTMTLSWHHGNASVSVEVSSHHEHLQDGRFVVYKMVRNPYGSDAYTIDVYREFQRMSTLELRYLLTHWCI